MMVVADVLALGLGTVLPPPRKGSRWRALSSLLAQVKLATVMEHSARKSLLLGRGSLTGAARWAGPSPLHSCNLSYCPDGHTLAPGSDKVQPLGISPSPSSARVCDCPRQREHIVGQGDPVLHCTCQGPCARKRAHRIGTAYPGARRGRWAGIHRGGSLGSSGHGGGGGGEGLAGCVASTAGAGPALVAGRALSAPHTSFPWWGLFAPLRVRVLRGCPPRPKSAPAPLIQFYGRGNNDHANNRGALSLPAAPSGFHRPPPWEGSQQTSPGFRLHPDLLTRS